MRAWGEWPLGWYTARHFVLQASPVTTIATAFNTLPLSAAMLANLDSLGYAHDADPGVLAGDLSGWT
jgi:hypothetical protein